MFARVCAVGEGGHSQSNCGRSSTEPWRAARVFRRRMFASCMREDASSKVAGRTTSRSPSCVVVRKAVASRVKTQVFMSASDSPFAVVRVLSLPRRWSTSCCEFCQCAVPRSTVPFPMTPLTSVCGAIEDGKLFFTHDSHYAPWLRPHRSVSTTLHFRD